MSKKGALGRRANNKVCCAICEAKINFSEASACWQSLKGEQKFICREHFKNIYEVILGWFNFTVEQKKQRDKSNEQFIS